MEPELQSNLEPDSVSSESLGAFPVARERNWIPMAIAAALAVAVLAAVLVLGGHSKGGRQADAGSSSAAGLYDPYAASLPISGLAMSESSNLSGGKVTYVDGRIANQGDRTVTGAWVQVIFRDYKNEVAQSQRLPLTVIRMREPYIDTALLSALPLKPGAEQDFRLNFDVVSPDWSGALPEVRVVQVQTK